MLAAVSDERRNWPPPAGPPDWDAYDRNQARRTSGWGAAHIVCAVSLVASAVLFLMPLSASFLGIPDSCGNVVGFLAGADKHVDGLDMAVCIGTIHTHEVFAFALVLVAAVAGVRSWEPKRRSGRPQR